MRENQDMPGISIGGHVITNLHYIDNTVPPYQPQGAMWIDEMILC